VTGFNHIIDLSPEASARLRATKRTSGLEINENGTANNGPCRFLTRRALEMLRSASEHARVFASPNFALRLCATIEVDQDP